MGLNIPEGRFRAYWDHLRDPYFGQRTGKEVETSVGRGRDITRYRTTMILDDVIEMILAISSSTTHHLPGLQPLDVAVDLPVMFISSSCDRAISRHLASESYRPARACLPP
jgi:hypothetical protein